MAQGETPLLPAVIGPHKIRHQHFLMLRWVLLCDSCSYFSHLLKTFELVWATNAHIIATTCYNDHCLLFRVCSFAELSFDFITISPEGAAVVYTNTLVILFLELHDTSMGHACLVCTQFYLLHTSWKVGFYRFLFPSTGSLWPLTLLLSLTTTFSIEETLMDFGYTSAPNLTHQGASVITEISSAHGYKNSTSSNSNKVIHGPELIPQH
jgi:hypothetical protein